jgi:probable rRNA maturation factor
VDAPQVDAPSEPRPVFGSLDTPAASAETTIATQDAESDPTEATQASEPGAADGIEGRAPRRTRRRRPTITGEADATPPAEAAEKEEPGETREAATTPEPTKRAASSEIEVNVVVPRGMGRRVNSKLIQQVTRLALEREGWDQPASLDVVIVSDDEMREINVTRRGIDEATDVLSFPMLELRPEGGVAEDFFVLPPEAQVHLGDVVISYARVESQADEAGHSRERELAFLTVHAVLHILGYDHDTEEKRRLMRRHEEDVLVELGLRRNGN